MTSPLDVPEILLLVALYLDTRDLARACQVSVLFHDVCTPFLWRTVALVGDHGDRVWYSDEGFRLGLTQYGHFVRTLHLSLSKVEDEDMEFIVVNCTRLKSLDLSYSNVTVDTLKILFHSDPYKTSRASTDNPEDGDAVDANTRMEQYRVVAEMEKDMDQDEDPHHYEIVGLPASSAESEHWRTQHQPTGSILVPASQHPSGRARLFMPERNTSSQGRSNPPAKFKGTKTRFPFHLEELSLTRCRGLSGQTLFPVLALLGPQLRDLSVGHIKNVAFAEDSSHLIRLLKHCPNLTRLNVEGADIDDVFLAALAGVTKELAPRAMEVLDLFKTRVNSDSLVPLVKVSRDKLERLTLPTNTYIKDSLIYAFIEDFKELNETLHPVRSFVRNDVLSVLKLNESIDITHETILELFRHTTALTVVELNGVDVRDDALEALAAANRNRMERLGLGIPQAWIQHEQGAVKFMSKQQEGGKQPAVPASLAGRKCYEGAWVPGGLQALSLKHCINVTNQGVRAIVRSCPMLWALNLKGCERVSMRVFRGPWVCNRMKDLNISYINMRIQTRTTTMLVEEQIEDERFPMTPLLKTRPSDDFRDDGHYDFITLPTKRSNDDRLHDSNIVDEDGPVQEDKENLMNPRKHMYPAKAYRNDGETRRTLNEFYRKLGQFDQLKSLNMGMSDYRIRIQDGLDLVLPSLNQNLQEWNIYRPLDYTFQDVELEWIGKHFGYGFDFSKDKDELERQRKFRNRYRRHYHEYYVGRDEELSKCSTRVSKLKVLQVCTDLAKQDNLNLDLYRWFLKSGFEVHLLDHLDTISDDSEDSEDESISDDELYDFDREFEVYYDEWDAL